MKIKDYDLSCTPEAPTIVHQVFEQVAALPDPVNIKVDAMMCLIDFLENAVEILVSSEELQRVVNRTALAMCEGDREAYDRLSTYINNFMNQLRTNYYKEVKHDA